MLLFGYRYPFLRKWGGQLDSSGADGGGDIEIGGGFQGAGARRSERTYVGDAVTIKADAIDSGDGGEVVLWADGAIPWEFALPAGIGDVAVGLMAMFTLNRLRNGSVTAQAWVRRTNIAGLTDFAIAIGAGLLSAPGIAQLLAADRPNELINLYPLVLIPVFAVPVFLAVHILSIRQSRVHRTAAASRDPLIA